ncbi:MAG: tail fiber domain-containing protein [candidate division Zixibacteria bacterium]
MLRKLLRTLTLAVLIIPTIIPNPAIAQTANPGDLESRGGSLDLITSVPRTMTYQGNLRDIDGNPAPGGDYNIIFRIYDALTDGNLLWDETILVTTSQGSFTAVLGETEPVNLSFNIDYYLSLQVVGDDVMEPRQKLHMNPYAAVADTSDYAGNSGYALDADLLDGFDSADFAGSAHDHDTDYVNENQPNSISNLMIIDGTILFGDIGQNGASSGQIMKWNGSAWVADNDETGAGGNGWADDGNYVRLDTGTDSVGIGTTTPSEKLDVVGNLLVSGKANIGLANSNSGAFAFVAGVNNLAGGDYSTVSGGYADTASSYASTVGGGIFNTAGFDGATVAGGFWNAALGDRSTIGGGLADTASGSYSTVGGGYINRARNIYGTVSGGANNIAGEFASFVGGGMTNDASGAYGTISGGGSNLASAQGSVVGGGISDTASGDQATVSGGLGNVASGARATIGGGWNNLSDGVQSTVGGGGNNTASGGYTTIAGGWRNAALGFLSAIPGGYADTIEVTGNYSYLFGIGSKLTEDSTLMIDMPHIRFGDETTGFEFPTSDGTNGQVMATDGSGQLSWTVPPSGGWFDSGNIVRLETSSDSVGIGTGSPSEKLEVNGNILVSGKANIGLANSNFGAFAFVAGVNNLAGGDYSTVSGGNADTASGYASTIGGGIFNTASNSSTTIGGGRNNRARGEYSVVAGGGGATAADSNSASGNHASILGGTQNKATGVQAAIGGGYRNIASALRATIGGGGLNEASGNNSTIAGGFDNTVSTSNVATIGGGYRNVASGDYSIIPGGYYNTAAGVYSFAAGNRAKANHDGSFVWADSYSADFTSSTTNQFNVRAIGGTRIYSNSSLTAGVRLNAGSSAWSMVSDSTLKRNIHQVDGEEILEKLAQLPISRWSYKAQEGSIEHIGPMAQDFFALFGLGEDDRHISTLDPSGVALAGVKELIGIIKNQNIKIEELEKKIVVLEENLN